jgi:membrane glycosyltransferase
MKSISLEIALSAILAPILMVANTTAVMQTFRGRDVGWRPQKRNAEGLAWRDAFRAMGWQTTAGIGFTIALCFRPDLSICFAPIVLPLLLAAPLAVLTSRRSAGQAMARAGFLTTPDDHGFSAMPVVFRAAPARVAQTGPQGHDPLSATQ